jgi:hypothetical protein
MLTSEFFQQNKWMVISIALVVILVIFVIVSSISKESNKNNKEGFTFGLREVYQPALKKNMTHFDNSVMLGIKDITEDYLRAFELRKEVTQMEEKEKVMNKINENIKEQILDTNILIMPVKNNQERKEKFYQLLYVMFGLRNISDLYRAKFVCRDPQQFDYCQDMNELTICAKSSDKDPMIMVFELYHQGCNKPVVTKDAPIDTLGKVNDLRYLRPSLNVYNNLTGQQLQFPVITKCHSTDTIVEYNDLSFEYSINTTEEKFKLHNKTKCFENNKTFINYEKPGIEVEPRKPDSDNLQDIITNFYKVKLPIKLDMVYKFRNRTDIPTVHDIKELAHQEVVTTAGTEYNLFVSDKNLLIKTIFNPRRVLTNEMVNDYVGKKIIFPYVCDIEGTVLQSIDKLQKVKRITTCQIKQKLSWTENEEAFSFVRTEKIY